MARARPPAALHQTALAAALARCPTASSAKALDYRLIRYESKGWLATGIRVFMAGLPSAIFIDSNTPGADVFESIVTPYAKVIFRGAR